MIKFIIVVIAASISLTACSPMRHRSGENASGNDGLNGRIRKMRLVSNRFTNESGRWTEAPPGLFETRFYDEAGNHLESDYAAESSLLFKVVNTYDADGIKIESVSYDPAGKVRDKTVFISDDNGRLTESQEYRGGDGSAARTEYRYDRLGNMIEWTRFNARGAMIDWWSYDYDDSGNRTREVRYYSDGSVDNTLVYKFNAEGMPAQLDRAKGDGTLIETEIYEYKSDPKGNWIQKNTLKTVSGSQEPVPWETTYREIEYR